MAVYTVHEPPRESGQAAANPERFVFVRDGFYFWAFLLAPLWMLVHRLWLSFVAYLVLTAALDAGLWFIHAAWWVTLVVELAVAILIGLEAATLRRWKLTRNGWRMAGVAVGDDVETAERRFFDAWTRQRAAQPAHPSPPPSYPPGGTPPSTVLGLFPEPGVPR